MYINPGLRVARRGRSSLQIGLEGGLVLDGLTEADRAVVAALATDRKLADLVVIGRRLGVAKARVESLVGALAPVLLPTRDRGAGLRADRLAGELSRLAVVHGGDAAALVDRRLTARVRVDGCGALAASIVTGLARAGIGRLTAESGPPVTAAEVAPDGFGLTDLGSDRAAALRRVCRAVAPETQVDVRARADPADATGADLWVLTSSVALDGDEVAAVDRYDGAVLPVVARERDLAIGPLVVPGVTACLGCRDRERTDADPAWPRLRDEATAPPRPPVPASSLVSAAAAMAVVQALSYLDGAHRPACWSTEVALRAEDGRVTHRPCHPHRTCLCGWAQAGRTAGRAGPGRTAAGPVPPVPESPASPSPR